MLKFNTEKIQETSKLNFKCPLHSNYKEFMIVFYWLLKSDKASAAI